MNHTASAPFDPHSRPPGYVYQRLADHLAALIDAGTMRNGSRLPAETEMAHSYGVSVGTLRRTVRELCERGLVIKIPSKGIYITKPGDQR